MLVAQARGALGGEALAGDRPELPRRHARRRRQPARCGPASTRANRDALVDAPRRRRSRGSTTVRALLAPATAPTLTRLAGPTPPTRRRALLEAGLAGGPPRELRVAVPNRPGVIADIALTLGRAGINISDMALSPSPDNSAGRGRPLGRRATRADERGASWSAGLGFAVIA